MVLLNDGFRSLAHNFSTMLLALALTFVFSAAYYFSSAYALQQALPPQPKPAPVAEAATPQKAENNTAELSAQAQGGDEDESPRPVWFRVFDIVSEVLFAAVFSAIYTIIFTLLARSIDRPLWKCDVPGEALRRFYEPWFVMTLLTTGARAIQNTATTADAAISMEFLIMLWSLFIIPVGACVMVHGAFRWEELGETLAPIGRQLRSFALVFFLGGVQYFAQLSAAISLPRGREFYFERAWAGTLFNVPSMAVDLLLFCICWRICILDRDTAHHAPRDFDD